MAKPLLAYYGGTFDPIHFGHIKPVEALARQVGLHKVVIIPNNVPPHRPQPEASSAQRKAMIEAAIHNNALFELDDRELQRAMPSWTADTMDALRAEHGPAQPLGFIIGQDSLLGFQTWHRYADILACCHLLVCRRPSPCPTPNSSAGWNSIWQAMQANSTPCLPGKFTSPTPRY